MLVPTYQISRFHVLHQWGLLIFSPRASARLARTVTNCDTAKRSTQFPQLTFGVSWIKCKFDPQMAVLSAAGHGACDTVIIGISVSATRIMDQSHPLTITSAMTTSTMHHFSVGNSIAEQIQEMSIWLRLCAK